MVSAAGALTAPAPFRYSTDTVWTPSPAGTVTVAVVENGWKAPNGPPFTDRAMSDTGSARFVGFDADTRTWFHRELPFDLHPGREGMSFTLADGGCQVDLPR